MVQIISELRYVTKYIIMKEKNTYIQKSNCKSLTFSKGEDLTDADLEIIKSRSKRTHSIDREYETYWEDPAEYTTVPKWHASELDYDSTESFTIGNNIAGGI